MKRILKDITKTLINVLIALFIFILLVILFRNMIEEITVVLSILCISDKVDMILGWDDNND